MRRKPFSGGDEGFTLVEMILVIIVFGLLLGPIIFTYTGFYSTSVRTSAQTRLSLSARAASKNISEELRLGSGLLAANTITDPNTPPTGWSTDTTKKMIVLSTAVLNNNNNFIINTATGLPYQNEFIYFLSSGTLYKRTLSNTAAAGNSIATSCPAALATSTCPADIVVATYVKNISFVLYTSSQSPTTTPNLARSIKLNMVYERITGGPPIVMNEVIEATFRNKAN